MGMEQSRELHAMHRERLAAAEAKWVRALLVRDGFGFVPGCAVHALEHAPNRAERGPSGRSGERSHAF